MGVPGRIGDIQPFAEIASGPDTVVYKAHQRSLDRVVLLKMLQGASENREALARFAAAARIVARIQHANVVAVHDYGEVDGDAFVVTEFIEGMDLAALLAIQKLPPDLALFVLQAVARGLAAAHMRGVIHRDIKPANILLSYEGDVKLADFGMASLLDEEASRSEVRGTLGYLSPEQIAGERADERSDLFALGATFFEMLTGRRAFPGDSRPAVLDAILHADPLGVLRVDRRVPTPLVDITARLLAKSPDARYATVGDLVRDLDRIQRSFAEPATPEHLRAYLQEPAAYVAERNSAPFAPAEVDSPQDTARRPERSYRRPVAAIAALVLLLVLMLVWARPFSIQAPSSEVVPDPDRADEVSPGLGTVGEAENAERGPDEPGETVRSTPGESDDDAVQEGPSLAEGGHGSEEAPQRTAFSSGEGDAAASRDASQLDELGERLATGIPEADAARDVATGPATWVIRANPWVDLYLDDRFIGTGPLHELSVEPGDHRLRFEHPQFPPHEEPRIATSGGIDTIEVSLWDRVGRLIVRARPWADVYVDGALVGTVPPHDPFIVEPGERRVRLERAGVAGSRDTTLQIRARSTVTWDVDMGGP